MEKTWWYQADNYPVGPYDEAGMIQLIENRFIRADTPVSKEENGTYHHLHQYKEFSAYASVSYPLPARIFARYFARVIDLMLCHFLGIVVLDLLKILVWNTPYPHNHYTHDPIYGYLYLGLAYVLGLCIDAGFHWFFGRTPGKYFFNIKVHRTDDVSLGFLRYLQRNMHVFVSGLAFGIPVLTLLTRTRQAFRLRHGFHTTYDLKLGTRVYQHYPIPPTN